MNSQAGQLRDVKVPVLTIATIHRDDLSGLQETHTSLANQRDIDWDAIEWTVVDGSNDSLATEVATAFPPTHVRPNILWEDPKGIYPAMNSALAAARGDFILFLNAGDRLASDDSLRTLLAAVLERERPTWVVGRVRIRDRGGHLADSARWDFKTEQSHFFARGLFPPHQATVVNTQVLRDLGGFDTRYAIAADYHAALRCSQRAEPVMLDAVIAEFAEGGVSTTRWKHAAREFHRARLEVLAPTGFGRVREAWYSLFNALQLLLYRDVLRRGR